MIKVIRNINLKGMVLNMDYDLKAKQVDRVEVI